MSEPVNENGHEFVTGEYLGFGPDSVLHYVLCCKRCGVIRRKGGGNKPCIGPVRVETRGKAG